MNENRDEGGKFVKGKTPNATGRKGKVAAMKEKEQQVLNEILAEAKGEAVEIYRLMLTRGSELNLSKSDIFKLCRDLAPYQSARKASIEQDIKDTRPMNFLFNGISIGQSENDLKLIEEVADDNPEQ